MFYCDEIKSTPIDGLAIATREPVWKGVSSWTRKAINAEIDAYFGEGSHEYFSNWTRDELLRDLSVSSGRGTKQTVYAIDEIKAAHVLAHGIELAEHHTARQ